MKIKKQLELHIRKIADMQPHEEVNNELFLDIDLGMDSIDTMELTMEIEKDFGISIDDLNDKEYQKIKTVGDIYTYLEKNHNIK